MANLSGDKAREFVVWLEEAKFILPPMTKISEARLIWERKVAEEEELKDETEQEDSELK